MSLRTCAADDCKTHFEPYSIDQIYCSHRCGTRMRVRELRRRRKYGGDDGGGGKQRRLFPKPLLAKAKPPKPVRVAEPMLFEGMSPRKSVARERSGGKKIATAKAV